MQLITIKSNKTFTRKANFLSKYIKTTLIDYIKNRRGLKSKIFKLDLDILLEQKVKISEVVRALEMGEFTLSSRKLFQKFQIEK